MTLEVTERVRHLCDEAKAYRDKQAAGEKMPLEIAERITEQMIALPFSEYRTCMILSVLENEHTPIDLTLENLINSVAAKAFAIGRDYEQGRCEEGGAMLGSIIVSCLKQGSDPTKPSR